MRNPAFCGVSCRCAAVFERALNLTVESDLREAYTKDIMPVVQEAHWNVLVTVIGA